jgi:ascorbate-specific PTS system EIIC-type component UlaA
MNEPVPNPLPPMNGTLRKLYDLASLPDAQVKKPSVLASSIKDIALVLVYIYTNQVTTNQQMADLLKMLSHISSHSLDSRTRVGDNMIAPPLPTVEDARITKMLNWFGDKILPYFVIGIIYLVVQLIVDYYKNPG